ncbi:helix-turn-helix transcriptional regulator [Methanobacterium sp. ACI-7]|uniref:helix-turn-helix transcriptional regulator n=1 Tax=unclassified Methanobacterium TaxID=2627676 RepID=UPI0039C19ADE
MDAENNLKLYEEVADDLKFHTISAVRMKIIILLSSGPAKTKQLRELSGIQSSTILHGINDLEKEGLVIKDGDNYYLSEIGKIIALKLFDTVKTLNALKKGQSLWLNHEIDAIPEELLMNISCLSNSKLITSDNINISKVTETYKKLIGSAKAIKGITPFFHQDFVEIFENNVKDNEIKVELILTDTVLKEIIKGVRLNIKSFIKLMADKNLNIWLLHEEPKVALTVTDQFLSLGLYAKNGSYDIFKDLISEDPDAIEWGYKLFEYYRKEADKVELKRIDKLISYLI